MTLRIKPGFCRKNLLKSGLGFTKTIEQRAFLHCYFQVLSIIPKHSNYSAVLLDVFIGHVANIREVIHGSKWQTRR